jgi:hypothetical protein
MGWIQMNLIKLIFLILLFAVSCFSGAAQKLNKIEEFSAYDNEVQVRPGVFVIVRNDVKDGKTNRYAFKSGRFVRVSSDPLHSLDDWNSFNWANVDFLDQIARSDFESTSLSSFIPAGSKVKGFGMLDNFKPGKTLVFICYATKPQSPDAEVESEEERDLHVMMLARGPLGTSTTYEKLADLLVAEESYFGAMVIQPQPKGALVFLYSTSIGGTSHLINSVDVLEVSARPVSVRTQASRHLPAITR